jgi:hypothetical protein
MPRTSDPSEFQTVCPVIVEADGRLWSIRSDFEQCQGMPDPDNLGAGKRHVVFWVQKHKKSYFRVVPGIFIADFLRFCGARANSIAVG